MSARAGVHKKGSFTAQDAIDRIKKNPEFSKAGAIGLFIGVVRDDAAKGQKVERLQLEAYEEKANDVLNQICNDLTKKPGIIDAQIHHLLGDFKVGDELVYVAVAGSHRQEMFPVLREAVERYKSEAPVFKKERVVNAEGSASEYWVSEKHNR